jgi:spore germination protein AB
MKTKQKIAPHLLFNSYLILFIINMVQVGVGVTNFQSQVFKYTRQDSWIPVLIAGICAHMSIYFITKTLEKFPNADLFDIHKELFGKIIGNILSVVYICYFSVAFIALLSSLYEMIRTYIFWDIHIWIISFMFITVSIYCVMGGVRVIAGFCFLSFFCFIWAFFLLKYPISNLKPEYYFPIFESSYQDIAKGSYQMITTIAGFEVLYFFYPYAKEKNKIRKYAFAGNFISMLIYLYLMLVSIGFFSPKELENNVWVTLNLFKVVHFPFLEQFQVVMISLVTILVAPNCVAYLWLCSKGMKKIFHFKQKHAVYVLATIIFLSSLVFYKRSQIATFNNYFEVVMVSMAVVYPTLLFFYTKIYLALKKNKEKQA